MFNEPETPFIFRFAEALNKIHPSLTEAMPFVLTASLKEVEKEGECVLGYVNKLLCTTYHWDDKMDMAGANFVGDLPASAEDLDYKWMRLLATSACSSKNITQVSQST
jgi:hypothetical protein